MEQKSDKIAVVTGASSGIGLAVAKKFTAAGTKVVMAARNIDKMIEECEALPDSKAFMSPFQCDVTQASQVAVLADHASSISGKIDIWVNNAGTIDPIARIENTDPLAWATAIDVNVKGVFFGIFSATEKMRDHGGTIINMSSGAANSALDGWSHYCSSKAAVRKITECAHHELVQLGINVIGLSPGTVTTPMMNTIRASVSMQSVS